MSITGDSGVITLWGNEKINSLSKGDGIYCITNDNRLVISKIKTIIIRDVEDYEMFSIKTTGFRGKISCDMRTTFIEKYKDNDNNSKERLRSVSRIEKGNRLKELNNSVIYYEFGEKVKSSSKVKEINKNMFTGSIYDIEVASEIKGIIVNSLIIIN